MPTLPPVRRRARLSTAFHARRHAGLATVLLACAVAPLRAQPAPYRTMPPEGASQTWGIGGFGLTALTGVGQRFQAPHDAVLSGLTVWINRWTAVQPAYTLAVHAAGFDGPVGPALWTTASTTSGVAAGFPLTPVTTPVGRLPLVADAWYVALLTPTRLDADGVFGVGLVSVSPNGQLYWQYGDKHGWDTRVDLAFQADFAASTVPEPATGALVGLGLLALARRARRRRALSADTPPDARA